jgi:hypothetical protein
LTAIERKKGGAWGGRRLNQKNRLLSFEGVPLNLPGPYSTSINPNGRCQSTKGPFKAVKVECRVTFPFGGFVVDPRTPGVLSTVTEILPS